MDPQFLSVEEILDLHNRAVARYGGGSTRLLSVELLESAVAIPTQRWAGAFLHESLGAMAAAYLFHIVSNHPFADGNKRVGVLAAETFLLINGLRIAVDNVELERWVRAVAESRMKKNELKTLFEQHVKPLEQEAPPGEAG